MDGWVDFGFIFDHSPGGDMRFENAPFKLSTEMLQVMGGDRTSEHFQWFTDLCIRAFLTLRYVSQPLPPLLLLWENV